MSHTILYLADRAFTAAVNAKVEQMVKSRAAYEAFVGACWGGEVRYPHASFVADARKEKASTRDVYFLAYPLLSEPIDAVPSCTKVALDVELRHLLRDCLPWEEYRDQDEEEIGLPRPVFRLLQAGPLEMRGSEKEARRALTERGLRGAPLQQAFLLNKLCNRRDLRLAANAKETAFPIWIAAGWDNYEGHLGDVDMAALDPAPAASLLAVMRTAAGAVSPGERWVARTLDQLLAAREALMKMGRGATCLAVSSV